MPSTEPRRGRAIGWWLVALAVLVFAMVVVGGATRLTESGLSIVEWKPVTGALPPLSETAWQSEFDAYKASPQYRLVNRGMSLDEFKAIFWWEWAHRLLGRLIGIAFLVPFLWFLARRQFPKGLAPRLAGIFVLGGAQGALGWWMVASGLVNEPAVSHYRLAAHLGLALVIFAALVWTAMDILFVKHRAAPALGFRFGLGFVALLALQIIVGAFVAGLDAGQAFNTWPLMAGAFVPGGVFAGPDPLRDALTVQFSHRMLAYLVTLAALAWAVRVWRQGSATLRRLAAVLAAMVILQVMLGVATLLAHVPVGLGTAHQGVAVILLAVTLALLHRLRWGEGRDA